MRRLVFEFASRTRRHSAKQQGVTLIELLVGLLLGLLLTGIMGTIYVTSKISFNSNTQVARVQENLRFTASFLQRDVRELSYSECGNTVELLNRLDTANPNYIVEATTSGIYGWEYSGTGIGQNYALAYTSLSNDASRAEVASARTSNAGTADSWDDLNDQDLPALIAGFSPMAGSDVLMLASEYKTDIELTNTNGVLSTELGVAEGGAEIGQGHVLKVGDCRRQEKFQNNSADAGVISRASSSLGGFNPSNSADKLADNWKAGYTDSDSVYSEVLKVYYVGTGTAGLPSLFLYTSECGLSALGSGCSSIENVELIEGVENLQLVYGEDTDDDGIANIYRTANDVTDFAEVVSIRAGLLLRSVEQTEDVDGEVYTLVDEVDVNPPDLRLIRYASNMTLHLRNRGR